VIQTAPPTDWRRDLPKNRNGIPLLPTGTAAQSMRKARTPVPPPPSASPALPPVPPSSGTHALPVVPVVEMSPPKVKVIPPTPHLYTDAGDALDPAVLTHTTIRDTLFLLEACVFLPEWLEDDPHIVNADSLKSLKRLLNGCLTKRRYTEAEIDRVLSRFNRRVLHFTRYRCLSCLGWHLATVKAQRKSQVGHWKAM
jgi:hypothetical protein